MWPLSMDIVECSYHIVSVATFVFVSKRVTTLLGSACELNCSSCLHCEIRVFAGFVEATVKIMWIFYFICIQVLCYCWAALLTLLLPVRCHKH